MDTMKRKLANWAPLSILMALTAQPIYAQTVATTPNAQETTASAGSFLKDKFSMSYTGWLTGPHIDALDGGVDGANSNLNIDHFYALGYKINSDMVWRITQDVTQQFGKTYDAPDQQAFVVHNPYTTLAHSHLYEDKNRGINVAGYIRYYIPVANADRQGKNAPGMQKDQTNGLLRMKLDPTKTFLDGSLTISLMTFVYRGLAGKAPGEDVPNQRDWFVYFYPGIQYQATKTLAPYIRYSSVMEHYGQEKASNGGGHWQALTDNHNLEFGFDYNPTASITITPYTEFGAPGSGAGKPWQFSKNTLGLIAQWDFI